MEYLNGQDCSLLLTATGKGHIVPPVGPGQGGLGRIPVQVSILDLILSPPRIDPSLTLPSLPGLSSGGHFQDHTCEFFLAVQKSLK